MAGDLMAYSKNRPESQALIDIYTRLDGPSPAAEVDSCFRSRRDCLRREQMRHQV